MPSRLVVAGAVVAGASVVIALYLRRRRFARSTLVCDCAACVVFDADGKALILQRGPTAPWMPLKWNL
jgi:hypothetical protein